MKEARVSDDRLRSASLGRYGPKTSAPQVRNLGAVPQRLYEPPLAGFMNL